VLSSCSLDNWCQITSKTYKILLLIYVKSTCYLSHAGERKKIPTDVEDAVVLFNQTLNWWKWTSRDLPMSLCGR
jgi:hypothetical protein